MTAPRLALLGALAMLAVGFVWADRFPALDPVEFQVRLERWRAMDAAEQGSLRQAWTEFQALPEERRDALRRRKGALDRLRRHHEAPRTAASEREALEVVMGELERQARELLAADADADVRQEVKLQTQRRVDAFLENLARSGHIDTDERRRLAALPFDQRVLESLLVLKREQLALYADYLAHARGAGADDAVAEPAELVELRALDPIEVVDELRGVRAELGLLGPAARLLQLPAGRRDQLAEAIRSGHTQRVVDWLRPHLAEALEARGVDAEVIASTLELPFAELERRLDRLVRQRPSTSPDPVPPEGAPVRR